MCWQITWNIRGLLQVSDIVLRLLEDDWLEVREKASQVLGGLLHCDFIESTDDLIVSCHLCMSLSLHVWALRDVEVYFLIVPKVSSDIHFKYPDDAAWYSGSTSGMSHGCVTGSPEFLWFFSLSHSTPFNPLHTKVQYSWSSSHLSSSDSIQCPGCILVIMCSCWYPLVAILGLRTD
jgi:hypothetical protein